MKGLNAIAATITAFLGLGYLLSSGIAFLVHAAIKIIFLIAILLIAYYLFLAISKQTKSITLGLFAGGGMAMIGLIVLGGLL